ncbi:MAG: endolytic transglycosylase MltG [Ginsengibacter sp.]
MKTGKIIAAIFFIVILFAGYFAWQLFGPTVNGGEKKFLYIKTNSTYKQVKDSLLADGSIKNDFWMDKVANYVDYPENVKPGKYKISKGMSIYSLVKKLRSGKQETVNLVITKLRTKEDLAKRISRVLEVDSLKAIEFLNDNRTLQSFDVDSNTVLTAVIPNTYTYYWTTSMEDIFAKLYKEEKKFWNEKRTEKAKRLQLSEKQIYIIASIVEEETNKQDDKGKIASVYMNRLNKGMRLGADPTVKFAMKDFGLKRIYHKHLQFESPYNTYRNSGLPPGPICTPSINTIDAVLDAPETDYLFFVARADFSGYSDFANNYQQHLLYAKAYQQALNTLMEKRQEKNSTP